MDVGRLIALFLQVGGGRPAVVGDIMTDFFPSFQDVTALTQPVSAVHRRTGIAPLLWKPGLVGEKGFTL